LGGLGVLPLVHQIRPPPLGGEPIRVVMGELELDIARIRIVRISPVDGDALKVSPGSDRICNHCCW
jgi:hypothetical protein